MSSSWQVAPRRRSRLALLTVFLLAVFGIVWLGWGGSGEAGSEAPAVPTPAPMPAPMAPAAAASLPVTAAVAVRTASGAAPTRDARSDPSKFQREVQQALSSDKPGLAGPAAQHIAACVGLEKERDGLRAAMEARQRAQPGPHDREAVVGVDQFFAGCQALDAAARAQLLPLLRRSLQEGDRGAGAELARQLGKDFDPAREPAVVAALRQDAWACDRSSINVLSLLSRPHPQLLTANELGAIRQMQGRRAMWMHAAGDVALSRLMDRFKPPAEADPAEVDRLAAGIQARCSPEAAGD
jgi:hypothetical protein